MTLRSCTHALLLVTALASVDAPAHAQSTDVEGTTVNRLLDAFDPTGPINVPLPTFGGLQVWSDIRFREGWRVQRNALTGHARLLDDDDVRRAWGTVDQALAALDAMAPAPGHPAGRHLVVLVHGALRTPHSFATLEAAIAASGYEVASVTYDSSLRPFDAHVADLTALMTHLEGYERVSFVTHSMGGLLARALLASPAPWRARLPVRRLVQIAPPNRGSLVAETMRDTAAFKLLYGPAGERLMAGAATGLPIPDVPFGIIAGGTGDGEGYNPLIPGDDDGTVAVRETLLAGAQDFLRVDALHSFILDHPATVRAVLSFLDHGRFAGPVRAPAK